MADLTYQPKTSVFGTKSQHLPLRQSHSLRLVTDQNPVWRFGVTVCSIRQTANTQALMMFPFLLIHMHDWDNNWGIRTIEMWHQRAWHSLLVKKPNLAFSICETGIIIEATKLSVLSETRFTVQHLGSKRATGVKKMRGRSTWTNLAIVNCRYFLQKATFNSELC